MIDWSEILSQLNEMCRYFVFCRGNAGKGTAADRKFAGYIQTLDTVMQSIREMLEEDNDGR